jgi:radical SAM superfamily enzyme YgiQ (UPF0313 family)
VRVLLVSTYDLGRQPFGLASPAAWLRREGFDVTCADVAKARLADDAILSAGLVAFYLPMHTATRLTAPLIERVRRVNPEAHICCYGLYASLNEAWLRERGVDSVLGGEFEDALVTVARDVSSQVPTPDSQRGLPRLRFIQPDREGLPSLGRYAALTMPDGTTRVVGATEASRGCKHLCRHCPIVPVYAGEFRVVPVDVVLADILAQVRAGAQHMTFGDPDFLNGPAHARRLVLGLAAACPGLTYDVTIKIEHLLKHADLLPVLRDTGCLFITSAVESVDDEVLEKLRKGHTRADFAAAVALCRAHGVTLSPTFLPFTPWTTVEGYVDLLETIERLDLVDHVAPIQLAIRLLITVGSPLLDLPDVRRRAGAFDANALTWSWSHQDPRVDRLQQDVATLVAVRSRATRRDTFAGILGLAHAAAGRPAPRSQPARARATVPYLNEPWYC